MLPGARRLEELGASGKKDMPDVSPIDTRPRSPLALTDLGPPGRLIPLGDAGRGG